MHIRPGQVEVEGFDAARPNHVVLRVALEPAPDPPWVTCFRAAGLEVPEIPGDAPAVEGGYVLLKVPEDALELALETVDLRITVANDMRAGSRPVGAVVGRVKRVPDGQLTQVDVPMTPMTRLRTVQQRASRISATFNVDDPVNTDPTRAVAMRRLSSPAHLAAPPPLQARDGSTSGQD